MPVTYTNRKGVTLYLCQSLTKTGKPRYYFAREPKGTPVEQIPDGFRVGENANGRLLRVLLEHRDVSDGHPHAG